MEDYNDVITVLLECEWKEHTISHLLHWFLFFCGNGKTNWYADIINSLVIFKKFRYY